MSRQAKARITKIMKGRLPRGTRVVVGNSYDRPELRSREVVVTSKGPVKCNGKGRCAGDWCVGLAVFVADEKDANDPDKKMGWRSNARKVCVTHLRDDEDRLILPPPFAATEDRSVFEALAKGDSAPTSEVQIDVVTWDALARAHANGDINLLAMLARKLKADNEQLRTRVLEVQERLIEQITR
jgi:hypothetical protein